MANLRGHTSSERTHAFTCCCAANLRGSRRRANVTPRAPTPSFPQPPASFAPLNYPRSCGFINVPVSACGSLESAHAKGVLGASNLTADDEHLHGFMTSMIIMLKISTPIDPTEASVVACDAACWRRRAPRAARREGGPGMTKRAAPARLSGANPTRQGPFRAAPQREGFYVIVTPTRKPRRRVAASGGGDCGGDMRRLSGAELAVVLLFSPLSSRRAVT